MTEVTEVTKVAIKSDLYRAGMISPDSAKFLAPCVIPGQITSGEMHVQDGRTMYEVSLIPERRSTNAKVSSRQTGGSDQSIRGSGWVS